MTDPSPPAEARRPSSLSESDLAAARAAAAEAPPWSDAQWLRLSALLRIHLAPPENR